MRLVRLHCIGDRNMTTNRAAPVYVNPDHVVEVLPGRRELAPGQDEVLLICSDGIVIRVQGTLDEIAARLAPPSAVGRTDDKQPSLNI